MDVRLLNFSCDETGGPAGLMLIGNGYSCLSSSLRVPRL